LREIRAAAAAREAGVGVPEPLAVLAVRIRGPFHRLSVVSREIEGAADLLSLAPRLGPRDKRDLLRRVADEMRRLHDAGVYHADLTLKNILVAGPQVFIIDLDKARVAGGRIRALDVGNLSRLNRSVVKVLGPAGPVTRTDKLRFLRRYLGGREGLRELARSCVQGLWAHRLWWALGG
jgi:3-deoxy-D-manno-octulosonic acid kinase